VRLRPEFIAAIAKWQDKLTFVRKAKQSLN
jgi:hypothetical protein